MTEICTTTSSTSATTTTSACTSKITLAGMTKPTTSTSSGTVGTKLLEDWLEEMHKWFILEGSRMTGVQSFLTAYFEKLRAMNTPIDMIFGGGVLLSEYTPGYIWTCESTGNHQCAEIEISREHFQIYSARLEADDPFVTLQEKRASSVRLRKGVHAIPEKSCPWYHAKQMTDYFALPILCNRGVFRGGFAWVTKCPQGFDASPVIDFLEKSMPAFSAMMRLQTNDCVMESLTVRVQEEIHAQTQSLKETNQQLEQANQRVREQAAAQLEHFACMSHEVRTPLNCIIGLSNLLLDQDQEEGEELTPNQRDSIQLITTSGDLLRTVVDDVLDYTKLAAGHIDIQIKPCHLQETILQSVRAFAGQCQSHQLTVRTFVGPNVPPWIESDNRRLSQVLYNLFGNAVKYSKDGGNIDIHLLLSSKQKALKDDYDDDDKASAEKEQQMLTLAIKDYGKGIDKKDIHSIFKPFHQTEASTSDSTYGGTGLGLSIASKIVHGLGGTISAESEVEKWCEFTVSLPCATKAVDLKELSDRLQNNNTVIVIMPDSQERDRLVSGIFGAYDVTAHVIESCSELDDLHNSSTCATKSYLCICDHALYDQARLENFARASGEKQVAIVTCGSSTKDKIKGHTDAHYESLSLVFPSVLMQKLCELVESTTVSKITKPKDTECMEKQQAPPSPCKVTGKSSSVTPPPSPGVTPPSPGIATKKPPVGSQYSYLKVLITEDNRINQKVLHKALSRLGLQNVDIVDNGAKAVELTAEKPFDLIFMDIQMPVMDGLEATRLITSRRRENNGNKVDRYPTVIFLSAHATESYKEKAREVGGDGFIAKPFQLPKIEDALRLVLLDDTSEEDSQNSQ